MDGLVKKLYKEFMIMGLVSFVIFLMTEVNALSHNKWFLAFEFTHIVALFIGIAFILQSSLFVILIFMRNKALRLYDDTSTEELLVNLLELREKGSNFMNYMFDYGPVTFHFPVIREKVEYKIIQSFFIRSYNLPPEFQFADYSCAALKTYIISLIEVRPISWLVLSFMVVLNLIRVLVIDAQFESGVCHKYSYSGDPVHRRHLAGTDDDGLHDDHSPSFCEEYFLREAFVMAVALSVAIFILGYFTEKYMKRLLNKILRQEEILEELDEEAELVETWTKVSAAAAGSSPLTSGEKAMSCLTLESRDSNDDTGYGQLVSDSLDEATITKDDLHSVKFDDLAPQYSGLKIDTSLDKDGNVELPRVASVFDNQNGTEKSIGAVPSSLRDASPVKSALKGGRTSNVSEVTTPAGSPRAAVGRKRISFLDPTTTANDSASGVSTSRSEMVRINSAQDQLLDTNSKVGHLQSTDKGQRRRRLYAKCLERLVHAQYVHQREEEEAAQDKAWGTRSNAVAKVGLGSSRGAQLRPEHFFEAANATVISSKGSKLDVTDSPMPSSPSRSSVSSPKSRYSGSSKGGPSVSRKASEFFSASSNNSLQSMEQGEASDRAKFKSLDNSDDEGDNMQDEGEQSVGFLKRCFLTVGAALKCISAGFVKLMIGHGFGWGHADSHDDDVLEMQESLKSIFLWGNAALYFYLIEIILLTQCLYIALWATNIIKIAEYSRFSVLWEIALTVPIPLNFFVLKQILFTASMLKSVVALDVDIADELCDKAVEKTTLIDRLRLMIKSTLAGLDFERITWKPFLIEQFKIYQSRDMKNRMHVHNFQRLLRSLQIRLPLEKCQHIFEYIDVRRKGYITCEAFADLMFPELQRKKIKIDLSKKKKSFKFQSVRNTASAPMISSKFAPVRKAFDPELVARRQQQRLRGLGLATDAPAEANISANLSEKGSEAGSSDYGGGGSISFRLDDKDNGDDDESRYGGKISKHTNETNEIHTLDEDLDLNEYGSDDYHHASSQYDDEGEDYPVDEDGHIIEMVIPTEDVVPRRRINNVAISARLKIIQAQKESAESTDVVDDDNIWD